MGRWVSWSSEFCLPAPHDDLRDSGQGEAPRPRSDRTQGHQDPAVRRPQHPTPPNVTDRREHTRAADENSGVEEPGPVTRLRSHAEHSACACGAVTGPCGSGIAHQTSGQPGLELLCRAVEDETEPLATVTLLLRLCRDEHRTLWECAHEPSSLQAVADVTDLLTPLLPPMAAEAAEGTVPPRLRTALTAALRRSGDVPPVVVAHALADLLDAWFWPSFAASFRKRSPYQPGVGDPVPISSLDVRGVVDMNLTSPPWRLANRMDSTRHLRLAGDWTVQFRVVFDYALADVLAGLVSAETVVGTCSPNSSAEELSLSWRPGDSHFPVGPRDERRQLDVIDGLITEAVAAGADIVVLPELAVTEAMAGSLEDWVRRPDGPRVLVAGSYHHQDSHPTGAGSTTRRRNTAVTWVRGYEAPLLHDKHSPGDRPILEDIQPDGWPELRVYVTRDGWHIVIAICRDLLNPAAVHALCAAGANLILVPAMSETLLTFGGPTAQLVGANQALVAIANNPARWPGDRQADRALFGHPGIGRQTKAVTSQEAHPGVALMAVRSAAVTWRTTGHRSPRRDGRHPQPPGWIGRVTAEVREPAHISHADRLRVTFKRSAVLVLLSERPEGPAALVSERAIDLSTYAGQWVFPGGAVDADDTDIVATALREAREEVGLDPNSVEILGLLPAHALLETGFLVTPVLAWSAEPTFDLPVNRGEVAAIRWLDLRRLALTADDAGSALELGTMTRSVLKRLAGHFGLGKNP